MEKKVYSDIPNMPDSLIDRIISKKVIIFVGAGISALCKYPLWGQLADSLIEDFRKQGLIDYQFEHSIKNGNYLPIQKITILSECLENGHELVNQKICDYLAYDKNHCDLKMAAKIAEYLFAFKSSIVTTNADLVFDNNDLNNEYEKYSSVKCVSEDKGLNRMSILHLHGSINDKDNLIFTERQYAENYLPNEKLGKVLTKLIKSDNTIVFIGYSMSEFELLKYFINPKDDTLKYRLCKLDAYFHSEEETRLKLDEAYFKALGVTLLPYFIDKNGYDALLDVLENWIKRINSQISPAGLLHLDLENAILNKPSTTSKHLVIKNFANVDPAFIQEIITKSKYYREWIKILWNATPLFNPEPYFVVLPSTDKTTRTFWSGLLIIRNYISKKQIDEKIDEKLNRMMKMVGCLIRKSNLSNEEQQNIDSISILLFEIAISKTTFIGDRKVFDPITKLYISKNHYGAYTAVGDIFDKKDDLIRCVSSTRLFEIVCLIASSEKNDKEHYEALNSNKIIDFILTNPELYYKKSIAFLRKTDWLFSNIGSFLHFPLEKDNFMYEQRMYANWLLISSPYLDVEIIKRDVQALLRSKKRIMNKIGLCLIGLRFSDLKQVFLDKIGDFFNRYYYTADLIQLLNSNSKLISQDDDAERAIKDAFEKANFGCQEDMPYKEIIKKAVSNALSDDVVGFQKYNLLEAEKEFIFHLDSSASFYSVDTNKEVKTIYDEIKDKDVDEAIRYVNSMFDGESYYFDTSVRRALDLYFEKKEYSSYKDKLKETGGLYLLRYICNTAFVPINNEGIQKFLYLYRQLTEDNKKESMQTILFTCQKMVEDEKINSQHKEQLIKAIDYKLFTIDQPEDKEIKIGTVINTSLHLYWSILRRLVDFNEKLAVDVLLNSVHYFYGIYKSNQLFKAIMASWFGFIYYYEEAVKKEEYFEYVFNKGDCSTSFKIFSYSGGTNWYLNKLCNLESFNNYISNRNDNSQERVALASRVVLAYLFNNVLEKSFKRIMHNRDLEVIERCFYTIEKNSHDLINNKYKDRFNNFLDGCIESFEIIDKRKFSVNQIFRFLIDIMVKEKESDLTKMWNFLVLLPKGLSYYHDDSIDRLLDTFVKTDSLNCKRLLNALFESYDYLFLTDTYIITLFNRLKLISDFKKELKRWIALIGNKNPALYATLSKNLIDEN